MKPSYSLQSAERNLQCARSRVHWELIMSEPDQPAEGTDVLCQLEMLPRAGRARSPAGRWAARLNRRLVFTLQRVRKVARAPRIIVRKLRERRLRNAAHEQSPAPAPAPPVLDLQPGDRVRVRPYEEIKATLDADGRFESLAYIAAVMNRYCGGTYTVRRRVNRFFDERTYRMLRMKRTVILDTVFCEPEAHLDCEWAGCERCCFLFWKEGWLERVDSAEPGADGSDAAR